MASKPTVNVVQAMAEERQGLLDAVNGSGLPATISEYIVRELLEAIHEKAAEEYAAIGQGKEE